jgi:hypothetical protein
VNMSYTGNSDGLATIAIKPADGASIYNAFGTAMAAAQTTGNITLNNVGVDFAAVANLVYKINPEDNGNLTQSGGFLDSITDSVGSIVYSQTSTKRPAVTTGLNSKQCLSFDGSNDVMVLSGGTRINSFASEATIVLIVETTDAGAAAQVLFHTANNGTNKSHFQVAINSDNDDYLKVMSQDTTAQRFDKNSSNAAYNAQIISMTAKEADKVYSRLKATKSGGTATTGTFTITVDLNTIGGNDATPTSPFKGKLYRVFMFSRVLSDTEITNGELWYKNYFNNAF